MKLDGKVSLVTGGTSGIGAATALELARRGSDIAINARKIEGKAATTIKTEIEALGRRCILIAGDMSVPSEVTRSVQQTAAQLGSIDVLVHSAGGAVPGGLMQVTPEAWYAAFDVHVHAIFHLCRAAVPLMKPRGEGSIILISSTAGTRGCLGALAYGTVKGALPQFARALARELSEDNIRVNVVAPGVIRTPFQDYLTPEQVRNNIANRIPLHREGKPEEVAEVIAMLVGNDFMTGETVSIDGGLTMRIA
jgi:NAD(P)-dependent dehydrogenase (short-subunit alcohol dehydrogenase family)